MNHREKIADEKAKIWHLQVQIEEHVKKVKEISKDFLKSADLHFGDKIMIRSSRHNLQIRRGIVASTNLDAPVPWVEWFDATEDSHNKYRDIAENLVEKGWFI